MSSQFLPQFHQFTFSLLGVRVRVHRFLPIFTRLSFFIVISQYYWKTWLLCWPHIYYLCLSFWSELNPRLTISFTDILSLLSKLIYLLTQLNSSKIIHFFTYNLYASLTESRHSISDLHSHHKCFPIYIDLCIWNLPTEASMGRIYAFLVIFNH